MSASLEAKEAAPFTILTEYLVAAAKDAGTISIPNNISRLFKSNVINDDSDIHDFHKVYGSSDHTSRLRLDHAAFVHVVSILLHLPCSHYQEKLLFDCISTVELLRNVEATQTALKRTEHIALTANAINTKCRKISDELIQTLIPVLVLNEQNKSMRLMAAHFLFALVHDCTEAQEFLWKQPEIIKLGPLIDNDNDYVLRMFTANLVRELCSTTSQPHKFWPEMHGKIKKNKHEDFPLTQAPDSPWLKSMANYLNSKDMAGRSHRDSHPFVCGLLSIDTGSHIFEDRLGANILAVFAEKLVFIIPSTATTPLSLLELSLDSWCECSVEEKTSADFQPDCSGSVLVHIETYGRGYQSIWGKKNAFDTAKLVLPNLKLGEEFEKFASRFLLSLAPAPQPNRPARLIMSSLTESRGSRRLDIGMIDLSTNSDAGESAASASDATSNAEANDLTNQQEFTRSQPAQDSRVAEEKLEQLYHYRHSESATFPLQGSLILDEQEEPAAQARTIDPRMLKVNKGDNIQAGIDAGPIVEVDFATYVEPTTHVGTLVSHVTSRDDAELSPPEHRNGPRQSTLPQQEESSSGNRARRQSSRRSIREALDSSKRPSLPRSNQQDPSAAYQSASKQDLRHKNPISPHSWKTGLESSQAMVNKPSAAKSGKPGTASDKKHTLKRPSKAQSSTNHPMDWDVGDIADEHTPLPATKLRPKISASGKVGPQSRPSALLHENSLHLKDSCAEPMLKRPRTSEKNSHIVLQKSSTEKHHEFVFEDENERVVPTSKLKIVAASSTTATASKKLMSQVSKGSKASRKKLDSQGRTAIQPTKGKIRTLASTRERRGQHELNTNSHDSGSDRNLGNKDEEAPEAPQEMMQEVPNFTRELVAVVGTKKATVPDEACQDAETSAKSVQSNHSGRVHSDHEMPCASFRPTQQLTQAGEVMPAHETVVTASPLHLTTGERQVGVNGFEDALEMDGAGPKLTQASERNADIEVADSLGEIVEDSYPMAAIMPQGLGASFGSKLGQMIRKSVPDNVKASIVAAHTTPLSNAKSFVDLVNRTNSARSKKKSKEAVTESHMNVESVEFAQPAPASRRGTDAVINSKGSRSTVMEKTQHVDPSSQHSDNAANVSNDESGMSKIVQQKGMTDSDALGFQELGHDREATMSAPNTPLYDNASLKVDSIQVRQAGIDGAESRLPDNGAPCESYQNHMTQQVDELEDIGCFIDPANDLAEIVSVTGNSCVDRDIQDNSGIFNTSAAADLLVKGGQPADEGRLDQQDEQTNMRSSRTPQAQPYTSAETADSKRLQGTERNTTTQCRQSKVALLNDETLNLTGDVTKKPQLVHFGKYGPQNQGTSTPNRKTGKTITGTVPLIEKQTQRPSRKIHTIAAVPDPLVFTRKVQVDTLESAHVFDIDHQGIVVEDDANMEDIGESAGENDGNATLEETAHSPSYHLPTETFKIGRSGSLSSRVDQNGSPRLQPQKLVSRIDHAVSDTSMTTELANDYLTHEENITSATEGPACAKHVFQGSDSLIHLNHESAGPRHPDPRTSTCSRAASSVTVSKPRLFQQAERRVPALATSISTGARESLGLSKIVWEQYPQAQENITTHAFKKPALKTTVSETFAGASSVFEVDDKIQVETSQGQRQFLEEMSSYSTIPAVAPKLSFTRSSGLPFVPPARVTKPASRSPKSPHPISTALGPTPTPFKKKLLAKHLSETDKKNNNILEKRPKSTSARRCAEDLDRTFVEYTVQRYHRRPSKEFSEGSTSPSAEREHSKVERSWRRRSQGSPMNVHDALLRVTSNVLFRLESEERAIEFKVKDYNSGCNNILKQFQDTNTRLFQYAGVILLKKATGMIDKLEKAFEVLQVRKINIRNAPTTDQTQRAVKLRQRTMADEIEQMLKAEQSSKV